MSLRVLVTGARGQVGAALAATAPAGVEVVALDRAALDVGDRAGVRAVVGAAKPQLIINAAAYTAVDKAEGDAAQAFRINGEGPGHLAEAAAAARARLIHVSTDYVFDGRLQRPYRPDDAPNPLNVYGASKFAGERAVAERLPDAAIVRTAWVYAARGTNFVNTMRRLMRERPEVRVVDDQTGSPTHAASLARCLWGIAARPQLAGLLHWTDAGETTWFGFAAAIRAHLVARGETAATVVPITTAEYPAPARRPARSVLDTAALTAELGPAPSWQDELRSILGGVSGTPGA